MWEFHRCTELLYQKAGISTFEGCHEAGITYGMVPYEQEAFRERMWMLDIKSMV